MDGITKEDLASYEASSLKELKECHPEWGIISTPMFAAADAIAYGLNREVAAIVEAKARLFTFEEMHGRYDSKLMIDKLKWDSLKTLSKLLQAPAVLVTRFTCGLMLETKLMNINGGAIAEVEFEMLTSKSSYEGGPKTKEVVKIGTNGSKILLMKQKVAK